jgi:hypothetical protein
MVLEMLEDQATPLLYYERRKYTYGMVCKGICLRHKAIKPVGAGRYVNGQKRCQVCEIFMDWPGLFCPCCGYRLRTRPRNIKYKTKLRSKKRQVIRISAAI